MTTAPVPAGPDLSTDAGFRAFYRAHVDTIHGYLLRLCGGDREQATELLQDTWCALIDELNAGRHERATLPWLLTVARSRYLDTWRRAHRVAPPLRVAWTSDEPVDPWEPERTEVLTHLASLDADHRTVLCLRYVDELDTTAVAELMGRSTAATHSLLARARRELRDRLTRGGDDA